MNERHSTEYPALDAFAARQEFTLDSFQRVACERLEEGKSVLVAAPTGSGKTIVAEFAVHLTRHMQGARIFYTTPIKALSNQKFQELVAEYGEEAVGLLTGDVHLRGEAPIVVMTTEVLRNMIYTDAAALAALAFVVLDEVHYLGDRTRGAVWEEIILYLPERVQLVSLSATVSNAEEFGDWMHAVRGNTEVVLSTHRPVPLHQQVLTPRALLPLYVMPSGEYVERGRVNPELHSLDQRATRSRGKPPERTLRRMRRSDIARVLEEHGLLPGIVFVFSRKGCEQAVQQCLDAGVHLTTSEERTQIRQVMSAAVSGLSADDRQVLGVRAWQAGLERGVAAHHAGLLPQFKAAVEQLFQRRLVKLVFATETLALGINMPARSVTIERLDKYNGEQRVPLTPAEYTQLTGRAGRRGIDQEGYAIVLWGGGMNVAQIVQLASASSFPIRSTFTPTPNMAVNLLQRMPRARARDTLELSFAQFQTDRSLVSEVRKLHAAQHTLTVYQKSARRLADDQGWQGKDRAGKLHAQIERDRKRIERRAGSIARSFDRVVQVLNELGYVADDEVTPWGRLLGRIYGDRDLLIAECIRHDAWAGIDASGLAALCCALSYEPRHASPRERVGREEARWRDYRAEGGRSQHQHWQPTATFRRAFERTLECWESLEAVAEQHHLGGSERPDGSLAATMQGWASGWSLAETLRRGPIGAGDFVRWTKQTIDLLDQLAQAAPHAEVDVDRISHLGRVAKQAKRAVHRNIVELSSAI